jgi:hypothetical protein
MKKLQALLSRSKGFVTTAAVGVAVAAPMANAADGDVGSIVTGLAVATTIAGIIAAATLKGSVNIVMMGARRVLAMIR